MATKGIVLLVDDEKMILDTYAPALRYWGYEAITRQRFDEAAREIRDGLEYDLLIVDGAYAGEINDTGFVQNEVIAASREMNPETNIISMSGYDVMPEGANVHLQKPVDLVHFLTAVKANMPNV